MFRLFSIFICAFLFFTNVADARNYSVGYHQNLRGWFTDEQFVAFEAGRRSAQETWSRYANITWSGSAYPNILIKPAIDSTAWARAPINGTWIAVSVNEKFRYAWKDKETWHGLFTHELGHILGMQDGGTGIMTITTTRPPIPNSSEIAFVQKKFGAPPKPPAFKVVGTSGPDEFTFDGKIPSVALNKQNVAIPPGTKEIVFDGAGGQDTAYLRGTDGDDQATCTPTGGTFVSAGFTVKTLAEINHFYGFGGNDTSTLQDGSGNDELTFAPEDEYINLSGNGYYSRVKMFESVTTKVTAGGTDVVEVPGFRLTVAKGMSIEFQPYKKTAKIQIAK